MDTSELKSKVSRNSQAAQFAPWSVAAGLIILAIYLFNAFLLSLTINKYFLVSKAERDNAQVGSALVQTLDKIQTTSAVLEPLKFVGLTFIILGISLFLIAILQILKLRGEATKLALAARGAK